jgi:hypothetical protein
LAVMDAFPRAVLRGTVNGLATLVGALIVTV